MIRGIVARVALEGEAGCCNTKPGPKAACHYISQATGVKIGQGDWHHLRAMAEAELGRELYSSRADAKDVAECAERLVNAFEGTPEQKAEFIRSFTREGNKNTKGTVDALNVLADKGELPAEIVDRKRRGDGKPRTKKTASLEERVKAAVERERLSAESLAALEATLTSNKKFASLSNEGKIAELARIREAVADAVKRNDGELEYMARNSSNRAVVLEAGDALFANAKTEEERVKVHQMLAGSKALDEDDKREHRFFGESSSWTSGDFRGNLKGNNGYQVLESVRSRFAGPKTEARLDYVGIESDGQICVDIVRERWVGIGGGREELRSSLKRVWLKPRE